MSALLASPWPAVYLTAWVVLVAVILLANHWAHNEPEPVNRIDELPPVPQSDATWLSAWPSGAHLVDFDAVHELLSEPLEQQQVDRMFHEILAMEGLS